MPKKTAAATAVTMAKVRNLLDVDEPNYKEAAKLGEKAIPHLETLVREADPMLASKATYLASLIQSDRAIEVVKAAAESTDAVVRVAAAAAVRNMPEAATEEVLNPLMSDEDPGVRKAALRAAPPSVSAPAPSTEGGPAPAESGGGSFEPGGGLEASESSGDVAGDGGGSIDLAFDTSASAGTGDGGGTVDGTLSAVSAGGEGGGN